MLEHIRCCQQGRTNKQYFIVVFPLHDEFNADSEEPSTFLSKAILFVVCFNNSELLKGNFQHCQRPWLVESQWWCWWWVCSHIIQQSSVIICQVSDVRWAMASHAQWAHKGIWHMITSFKQLNNCFSITTRDRIQHRGPGNNDYTLHRACGLQLVWSPVSINHQPPSLASHMPDNAVLSVEEILDQKTVDGA